MAGSASTPPGGTPPAADAQLVKARKVAAAVGLVAGAFGSMLGVGGGVLIAPAIANTCKTIPQRVIAGTSLAAVATTGVSAGGMLLASGVVDLTSAALIAGAALGMAPLGAKATRMFNCQTLRKLLGYWLLAVAPLVPLKPLIFALFSAAPAAEAGAVDAAAAVASSGAAALPSSSSSGGPGGAAPALALPVPTPAAAAAAGGDGFGARQLLAQLRPLNPGPDTFLLATGCLAGFASGLLGIGGGTVVTPLMAVATGLPQITVVGTSLVAMVLPSLVAFASHARLGNVDWRMAAGLSAGTLVGGALGSSCALAAPEGVLEAAFCLGMLFLGRKTLQGVAAAAKK